MEIVRPRIAQELERLRINGSIVGICEMSVGSYLVLADKLRLPSDVLLWGLKPHSTHYDYPNGCGSIMSSFSQVASSAGTVSKVELPTAYIFDDSDSEEDAITLIPNVTAFQRPTSGNAIIPIARRSTLNAWVTKPSSVV